MLKNSSGQYLNRHELYPLLGFAGGGHLPKEGFGPTTVQGTTFRCLPVNPTTRLRLQYLCPKCNWFVFVGRAAQHKCQATERRSEASKFDQPADIKLWPPMERGHD